jgi:hypothetical protein
VQNINDDVHYDMKRIFPYYDLEATLRYGSKPWPELPHVYLANMDVPADLRAFTKIYGLICRNADLAPDGQADFVRDAQSLLRKAWANDRSALRRLAEGEPERPTSQKIDSPVVRRVSHTYERFHLKITDAGMEIEADDVWAFTQLAFLRDHNLEKTKICSNPECPTPYFLQSKRGQIFCSHRCAVATNVRRFREGNNRIKKGVPIARKVR